ncbi:MAG: hypothetical protein LBE09_03875 [Christensenellaceae bacterium]|jgi:hypothetical protein|nr:hypothetical protein [Christensenellaceae bacterium]
MNDDKKYITYEVSEDLNARLIAEITRVKILMKMKNSEIADMLGKTRQAYSSMLLNGLTKIGTIEAIANSMGCRLDIKFVRKT